MEYWNLMVLVFTDANWHKLTIALGGEVSKAAMEQTVRLSLSLKLRSHSLLLFDVHGISLLLFGATGISLLCFDNFLIAYLIWPVL